MTITIKYIDVWCHYCGGVCQISKRCDDLNYHSRGFETKRDLAIRRLNNGALCLWIPKPHERYITKDCYRRNMAHGSQIFIPEQGKSEGFESCDRPIVRKRPIRVKSGDVLSRVTLKFDGWLWKTIGHLSFAVSSFVQHFITISEFKLELLSRNAQFR